MEREIVNTVKTAKQRKSEAQDIDKPTHVITTLLALGVMLLTAGIIFLTVG